MDVEKVLRSTNTPIEILSQNNYLRNFLRLGKRCKQLKPILFLTVQNCNRYFHFFHANTIESFK